jgi:CRP-like cAMP-binding protein
MCSQQMPSSRKCRFATVADLRSTELFRDVPDAIIEELVQGEKVEVSTLQPQTKLTLRRGKTEYIYIIVSGYLEVRLNSALIKKGSFLLAFRGPNQIVGEMNAIARESGVAFISASEPCDLIRISSGDLASLAQKDWRVYRNIAGLLIKKTRQERRRIEVSLMRQGAAQVAQALLNFLDERGADKESDGSQVIRGIVRQQDIADYIGSDRSTVAKPLVMLKKRGIIGYPDRGYHKRHTVKIFSRHKLEAVTKALKTATKKKCA